ncbi:MAG: S53 family peptidase [Candidatus Acidiferrales bacterium]
MRISRIGIPVLILVLGTLSSAFAQTPTQRVAVPYPTTATPKAIDRGALTTVSGTTPLSVTVALRLRDLNDAENVLKALYTQGDPQFHQFLTAGQFVARFAPTQADVAKVIAALHKYGLTAQQTTATTIKATGLPADMERAFSVSLHSYEVPAHDNAPGYLFHAPLTRAAIPAEISPLVSAVVGLDTRPSFRPMNRTIPAKLKMATVKAQTTTTPDPPGLWTVTDFADYYDVQPLYNRGVTGTGRTMGIISLAAFTPSDAFAYWSALGLAVNPGRLKIVNVDGGPGAPSDASGSSEPALDVEQSGGVAPGANIIDYQAPNTNQGFVDVFAAAIDANVAETISCSWLEWEWFFDLENSPVIDPTTGLTVGAMEADHELFLRAAIQGQTLFAASGDNGAYAADEFTECFPTGPFGSCSLVLSVGYPASDTLMTAAGGTTLPGLQEYCINASCTPTYNVNIPHERVWGFDYLEGLCAVLGAPDPIDCGIFAGGGGGGVSVLFEKPLYQFFLPGSQLSQPGQVWEASPGVGLENQVGTYYALPAHYFGRNVPDISANADPDTGYIVYYTSSSSGFSILPFIGGTSFVAPQLNGVSALVGDYLHGGRLGFLNFPLYGLALTGQAYGGPKAPLHVIAYGDNWFYYGRNGYSPAAGLGTMDVWNFARILKGQ